MCYKLSISIFKLIFGLSLINSVSSNFNGGTKNSLSNNTTDIRIIPESRDENVFLRNNSNPLIQQPLNDFWDDLAAPIKWNQTSEARVSDSKPHHLHRYRRDLLSEEQKQKILEEHNKYRSQEGAACMEYLVWNEDLARTAQAWARECTFDHGFDKTMKFKRNYDPRGQNIYTTTSILDMSVATYKWFEERDFYDFESNTCQSGKMCGHYTQVVWGATREIGCAWMLCASLKNSNKMINAKHLVCEYFPSGNLEGSQPYSRGEPCTKCKSRRGWCFSNMCRDDCNAGLPGCECRYNGCDNGGILDKKNCACACTAKYMGPQCQDECVDKNRMCNASPGWPPSYCANAQYGDSVTEQCPRMCQVCGKNDAPQKPESGGEDEFGTKNTDVKDFNRTHTDIDSSANNRNHPSVTVIGCLLVIATITRIPQYLSLIFNLNV